MNDEDENNEIRHLDIGRFQKASSAEKEENPATSPAEAGAAGPDRCGTGWPDSVSCHELNHLRIKYPSFLFGEDL